MRGLGQSPRTRQEDGLLPGFRVGGFQLPLSRIDGIVDSDTAPIVALLLARQTSIKGLCRFGSGVI